MRDYILAEVLGLTIGYAVSSIFGLYKVLYSLPPTHMSQAVLFIYIVLNNVIFGLFLYLIHEKYIKIIILFLLFIYNGLILGQTSFLIFLVYSSIHGPFEIGGFATISSARSPKEFFAGLSLIILAAVLEAFVSPRVLSLLGRNLA